MEKPVTHWVGTPSLSSRLAPSRDAGCRREIQLDRQLLRRDPDELEENRFQIKIAVGKRIPHPSGIAGWLGERKRKDQSPCLHINTSSPCSLLCDQELAIIHSLAEHELGSTRNPMFAQQVAQRAVSDEGQPSLRR
ncbi:hypothetical protein I7I51_04790 [Histoplasma capsulatum]|uniref:Uncharacterized protein n=1 Tax=Ajellomyces capsulatus TaxID=5037 RepID=A0A8A1M5S2_AJECA|nr:hypothetical protein I7I51_04790 [Histoplasma capsulatum]